MTKILCTLYIKIKIIPFSIYFGETIPFLIDKSKNGALVSEELPFLAEDQQDVFYEPSVQNQYNFEFEGGTFVLIASVPGHCLSFTFSTTSKTDG